MSEKQKQEIQIKGMPTPAPHICKFVLNQNIHDGEVWNYRSSKEAQSEPLLRELFELGGIKQIMVDGNTFTIDKSSEKSWPELGKLIGPILRKHLSSPDFQLQPPLLPERENDQVILEKARKLTTDLINPGLASHSGYVEILKVQDDALYVKMGGGCQGCAVASVTLKQQVEKVLLTQLPYIKKVVDITNHSAGQNPYYTK